MASACSGADSNPWFRFKSIYENVRRCLFGAHEIPPFALRLLAALVGCACWLRSPAPPKVQPMRPAWAFAALLLTLFRLRVRGSYSWRPSDLAPSLGKGGRAAEQRAGCQGWQPWAFRRSRNAQPERGGFSNPPFSDFTILLRPKIQGSPEHSAILLHVWVQGVHPWSPAHRFAMCPWLPARRFAPRPPLPKGEGICLYDRAASMTARSGAPRLAPLCKRRGALCARGICPKCFFQLLQGS